MKHKFKVGDIVNSYSTNYGGPDRTIMESKTRAEVIEVGDTVLRLKESHGFTFYSNVKQCRKLVKRKKLTFNTRVLWNSYDGGLIASKELTALAGINVRVTIKEIK